MTLFCLMVVNNWFIIADGFLRASGTKWSCLFFVGFFVLVNLVLLNILVALILECFAAIQEQADSGEMVMDVYDSQVDNAISGSPDLRRARNHSQTLLRRVLLADAVPAQGCNR